MEKNRKKQKQTATYGYSKILPSVFAVLSLIVMILPFQMPVNSTRAILSYIFIPQIRAADNVADYLEGVSGAAASLLNVAAENTKLKDTVKELKIQNAQTEVLAKENKRFASALALPSQTRWRGTWAKVIYREPSRGSTVIAGKGSDDGVELRAPVIAIDGDEAGLVGKVIEVSPKISKILLSSDEDFSATAFLSATGIEGLASGNGKGGVNIKYIPLGTTLTEGEKVYTSASSALFPDGILIGSIQGADAKPKDSSATFLMPSLKLAVDPSKIKEVLIMPTVYEVVPVKGGKK